MNKGLLVEIAGIAIPVLVLAWNTGKVTQILTHLTETTTDHEIRLRVIERERGSTDASL